MSRNAFYAVLQTLSPQITACVFSAIQALSHLFKRRVGSATERSYPKSHTELGIRTHEVALWRYKTWYSLTSVGSPAKKEKRWPTVIWGVFHFHTCAQGTIYWLQVPEPWEMAGFLCGCFGCVPHFRPLFQTVSFVWALAGSKTENANECLRSEHNIREASHFHFLSCESWVLNLSYEIKMKFPLKWWALPFVQIVGRHWISYFSGKPSQP